MSTKRQWSNAFSSSHEQRRRIARPSQRLQAVVLSSLLSLTLLLAAVPAQAQQLQPGPEMYAVPHLFALSTATTTRQFGMGGITTSLQDVGFPNAAFAGALELSQAAVRYSCTDFGSGLKLRGTQAWYATPLSDNDGLQILGFHLDSNRGGLTAPGLLIETGEEDIAVHYGRRISDRWLAGVGIAPVLKTTTRLFDTAGNQLASWDSKATWGMRVGALYQHDHDGYVGAIFDYYNEDVTFRPPAPGAPASELSFDSTTIALGASGRLGEDVTGAIEWMQLRSSSGDFRSTAAGLHLGLEYEATPEVLVRAGSNAGALTFGAGYGREGWVVNYAYISDWNKDEVGDLFGGSDTHQIEVGRYW